MTSEEGRLVGGRYRLDRRIGSGAMGVVWQAYDERLRRAVAVKQLRLEPGLDPEDAEEARERAMREGRIAARLHHPNAVGVFDVVDEDDAPWLVMEYVPSRSLAAEMSDRGVLPPEEVGRIGAQVAHALVAAHEAGIVHRDIKPANVLLGEDGTVKITDFGISRASGDVAVTKTGLIAGTPAYLAPEVAYGRPPEAPADVFSLGSTLYAAVEGEPPFGMSENTLGLLHAVAAGRINPPRQAGILTEVLVALLNADPAARPSAATAARWLDTVARGSRPDIRPVGPDPLAAVGAATAAAPGLANATVVEPTRAVTTAVPYGPGATRATTTAGAASATPPRRRRRPMVLAGIGVAAAAVLAALLFATNLFGGGSPPAPQRTNNATNPSQPAFQQVPPPQSVSFAQPTEVIHRSHGQPPPVTTTTTTPPPATTTTTTSQAPPTTTTTTQQETTTTAPTTTASQAPPPPSQTGSGNVGNQR